MRKRVGLIGVFLSVLTLSACSSIGSFRSTSVDYKQYLKQKLVEKKHYDRGKILVTAKILAATEELKGKQEEYVPGFAFPFDPSRKQIIIGLSLSSDEVFRKDSLKFFLNGAPALGIREEIQKPLIEGLYPFAFPFHRVLYVDFGAVPDAASYQLKLQTPLGAVEAELDF